MSKGDETRPHDKERFDENFERIFGPRPLKTWNPEEESDDVRVQETSPETPQVDV
jgi:hypothetical protein